MEIKVIREINEEEVARIAAYKLIEEENSISLLEAIENAIYEAEGVDMTITKEAVVQLKPILIDKLTATITHINNECVN